MTAIRALFFLGAASAGLVAGCTAISVVPAPAPMTIATGVPGSIYHPVGNAICRLFNLTEAAQAGSCIAVSSWAPRRHAARQYGEPAPGFDARSRNRSRRRRYAGAGGRGGTGGRRRRNASAPPPGRGATAARTGRRRHRVDACRHIMTACTAADVQTLRRGASPRGRRPRPQFLG
jgi:hypothetical protein